jgi:GT2 family glycosyltransferase
MDDAEFAGCSDLFTVVIVTFNSAHCVPALATGLAPMRHIIVIDNASDDETISEVRMRLPQAQVLVNERNLGFGAANNRALREVRTAYALLLNPDCLPDQAFFAGLAKAAETFPEASIIAPHLLRQDGQVELNYRWPSSHWKSRGPQALGPCSVGFVCGAAMLLNMPRMQPLGFFDESFFLYYEDEDLCQRVFLAKQNIVLVPHIEITHLSRRSVKGRNPLRSEFLRGYHHAQSKLLFKCKYAGKSSADTLRLSTLAFAFLALILRLLLPQPRYLARLLGRILGLWQAGPKLLTAQQKHFAAQQSVSHREASGTNPKKGS